MMAAHQQDLIYITVAIEPMEETETYLSQSVMALTDPETKGEVGSVSTTAGLGGDMVLMDWHGRRGKVRMSHILRQWVKSFDEPGARRLPVTGPPDTNGDHEAPEPEPPKPIDPETRERLVDRLADLEKEDDADGA